MSFRFSLWLLPALALVIAAFPQDSQEKQKPQDSKRTVSDQIHDLKARISELEALIASNREKSQTQDQECCALPWGMDPAAMGHVLHGNEIAPLESWTPGVAGSSQLLHIGATGFFLEHCDALSVGKEQQMLLRQIRTKAILQNAAFQRKIQEAEQDLWTLTCGVQPDMAKVEARIRDIEKIRVEQRMAFIQSIGEASRVLTEEQRHNACGMSAEKHQ